MRRVVPILVALLAAAATGCGSDGGTTTTTVTRTEPTPGGATTTTEPELSPAHMAKAERIDVGDLFFFKTPSGRIGCAVSSEPATLRCDTAFPTRFSHSGHTCEAGDYGQAFELTPSGPAKAICAGDTVLSAPDAHAIPYGRTWLLGPFMCISLRSGLSCHNGTGHGLALSLQAQRLT